MRNFHSPRNALVLIMLITLCSHLSICRQILQLDQEQEQEKEKEPSRFNNSIWYFPLPSPNYESRNEEENESNRYTVSHHKTPGGPNPLHN
ncbi:hypothetical protein ACP275_05G103100 [Erythranthe tilingii]